MSSTVWQSLVSLGFTNPKEITSLTPKDLKDLLPNETLPNICLFLVKARGAHGLATTTPPVPPRLQQPQPTELPPLGNNYFVFSLITFFLISRSYLLSSHSLHLTPNPAYLLMTCTHFLTYLLPSHSVRLALTQRIYS